MSEPTDRRTHWQNVHKTKNPTEVSWFQPSPSTSLELVQKYSPNLEGKVIDVGGGISTLVDHLLRRGMRSLSVLDVSEEALNHARRRLGADAERVRWIVGDILVTDIDEGHALWHDRAVFHFLTDPVDREQYAARMHAAVQQGGHAVIATFADDGPIKCSGLPVARYSAEALHQQFGVHRFELAHAQRDVHVSPAGKEQKFQYVVLRKI